MLTLTAAIVCRTVMQYAAWAAQEAQADHGIKIMRIACPALIAPSHACICIATALKHFAGPAMDQIRPANDPNVIAKSPIRAAGNIRVPILLLHGVDDTVVPISQSEPMAAALKKRGKPHTFTKLDGEDHWLSRSESGIRVLKEFEAFLASY